RKLCKSGAYSLLRLLYARRTRTSLCPYTTLFRSANNSCGSRSIRYGNMVHNVLSLKAILADGTTHAFGPVPGNLGDADFDPRTLDRKSTRLNSSHVKISYAVFCL